MKELNIGNRSIRWEFPAIAISLIIILAVCCAKCISGTRGDRRGEEKAPEVELLYGFDVSQYEVLQGEVGSGQTLSHLLDGYASRADINRIYNEAKPHYNFGKMKVGDEWTIFAQSDSLGMHLRHFVYEFSTRDMLFVSIAGDSLSIHTEQKEETLVRRKVQASIESSLWNCLVAQNIPGELAIKMEDIYGWSVDFFALHEGDTFSVVFDERFIDGKSVGVGTVWGSKFTHAGKDYYAIPFEQGGKLSYWDEKGASMRKQFLKAPLKFTRISSKFNPNRLHPVYKVRRPHLGVDYAAPTGTPVYAIADGTVTAKYWDSKGGGNVLKLKHTNGYTSSYLHLSKYAKGINVGTRVSQGQTICYVGNTGTSTGPHLDFRVYKNGKAIDPLKIPSNPVEPISKANLDSFESIKAKVMAELEGDVDEEDVITLHDLNPTSHPEEPLSATDSVRQRVKKGAMYKALGKVEN